MKVKLNNFDSLIRAMMKHLKEATVQLESARVEKDVDGVVFNSCREIVREVTLFLPIHEAISTLQNTIGLLEKSKE